jgi:26S proteasome regulatory subunit T4
MKKKILKFILFDSAEREYVIQEDFMKAVRKVADNKRLESKLDYKPV